MIAPATHYKSEGNGENAKQAEDNESSKLIDQGLPRDYKKSTSVERRLFYYEKVWLSHYP